MYEQVKSLNKNIFSFVTVSPFSIISLRLEYLRNIKDNVSVHRLKFSLKVNTVISSEYIPYSLIYSYEILVSVGDFSAENDPLCKTLKANIFDVC